MGIFYDDEEGGARGANPVPFEKWNAVRGYLRHFEASLYLNFFMQAETDGRRKAQGTAQYGSYDYECDEISLGEMIECLLGSDPAELDRERETEAFLGSGI